MKTGEIKRSHKVYAAWNWKQEVADLNSASDAGWQLLRGGCFSSKFRYDPSIRYRYQLDFPGHVEDKPRYLETFREQGWEYMNETFNGWFYFRKPYDEKADPVEYEIFTDNDSRMAMANRWGRIALIIAIIMGLMALTRVVDMVIQPCWPTLVHMLTTLITTGFFIRGVIMIRRSANGEAVPYDTWKLLLFLAVLVLGNMGWCALEEARPSTVITCYTETESIPADLEQAECWYAFDVKYADNYYLDLDVRADNPLTITLTDAEKNVIYTASDTEIEEDNLCLKLKKGVYNIYLSDFAGGGFDIKMELD